MPKSDAASSVASAQGDSETDLELNLTLHEVLDLLSQQVQRLQASLDFHRLNANENKEVIRWHVNEIDRRQDRIEEVTQMLLAADDSKLH